MPTIYKPGEKITIQEFNCRIYIRKRDAGFAEISLLLRDAILAYSGLSRRPLTERYNDQSSVIQSYISDYIQVNLARRLGGKVYLSNFKEYAGSYVAEFMLLVITTVARYGEVKESVNAVVADLTTLLEELIGEKGYSGIADVTASEIYTAPSKNKFDLKNVISPVLLVIVTGMIAYWVATAEKKEPEFGKKEIEQLVTEKIQAAINQAKIDFLYQKALTDTTRRR